MIKTNKNKAEAFSEMMKMIHKALTQTLKKD